MPMSHDYTPDEGLLDELETYFSYVLDSASLNQSDRILANTAFFNNSGKVFIDGPKIGRTLVYMTRPNLNLRNSSNFTRCRTLNRIVGSKFYTTLARFLMYGETSRYINYGGFEELNYLNLKILKNLNSTDKIVAGQGGRYVDGLLTGVDPSEDIVKLGLSYPIDQTNFIPLITNTCTEVSGGKDISISTYETEGDYAGNSLTYAQGMEEALGPGELTLSFDDLYGSPVMNLFLFWVYYIHYVSKGYAVPDFNYVVNRIIDYTCSIYVFMLDTDQKTILRWTKYCGCFPKSVPFSQISHSKEIDLQTLSKIQIPFSYNFACPMDPVVLSEFNMISEPALLFRSLEENASKDNTTEAIYNKEIGDFFRYKNHVLSFDEAHAYMERYPVSHYPKKILTPKDLSITRATDIYGTDPFNIYEGGDGDPHGLNIKELTDTNKYVGKYRGLIGTPSNCGQPYIVSGNQLYFL